MPSPTHGHLCAPIPGVHRVGDCPPYGHPGPLHSSSSCLSTYPASFNPSDCLETSAALSFQDTEPSWFSSVSLVNPPHHHYLTPPHQTLNVGVKELNLPLLPLPSFSPSVISTFQKFKYHFYSRSFSHLCKSRYPDFLIPTLYYIKHTQCTHSST